MSYDPLKEVFNFDYYFDNYTKLSLVFGAVRDTGTVRDIFAYKLEPFTMGAYLIID